MNYQEFGEGGLVGAIIAWFGSLIFMREKFVSTAHCKSCHQEQVKRAEEDRKRIYEFENRQIKIYGMVQKICGRMKIKCEEDNG